MAKENTQNSKTSKRILIVEDEHPLAHALELKFGNEGYETVIAKDGQEALEKARDEDFDLILLDLIMPRMDGFAFMEQLDTDIPIVVLSNLGQDEDRERAENLGAQAYYVKSNTPITQIIEKVTSLL